MQPPQKKPASRGVHTHKKGKVLVLAAWTWPFRLGKLPHGRRPSVIFSSSGEVKCA